MKKTLLTVATATLLTVTIAQANNPKNANETAIAFVDSCFKGNFEIAKEYIHPNHLDRTDYMCKALAKITNDFAMSKDGFQYKNGDKKRSRYPGYEKITVAYKNNTGSATGNKEFNYYQRERLEKKDGKLQNVPYGERILSTNFTLYAQRINNNWKIAKMQLD